MSTQRRSTIVYSKFGTGEYSSLGDWNAPAGSFTGTNMLVTRKGELCVRPGLKNQSPGSLSNGVVHGFGMTPLAANDAWFVQGTAVRTFDILGATNLKTSATALAETPTAPLDYDISGATVYIASATDQLYSLVPSTGGNPAVAALTGSPGAKTIAVYGDRLIVGNIDGSNSYRLRFSEAADFNDWPAGNFIDVGDAFGIARLLVQRQHLAILKSRSFHILTGVPGDSPVLRQIVKINGPVEPFQGAIAFPHQIYFAGLGLTYPSTFDGSSVRQLSYLENLTAHDAFSTFPPANGIGVTRGKDNCVTFVDGTTNKALVNLYGKWTKHEFGVDVSGYTVPVMPTDNIIAFCDGGGASANPKFYVWNLTADTPGIEGGTLMRAGDDSSTALAGSVTFPEWWAENGDEFYVRAVAVDFRSFATGSATTNHFDLAVTSLRRYDGSGGTASNTVSFDQAAASSSATGTLQRRVYGFGEQGMGNGFQLAFSTVRGLSIHRVAVEIETRPLRV